MFKIIIVLSLIAACGDNFKLPDERPVPSILACAGQAVAYCSATSGKKTLEQSEAAYSDCVGKYQSDICKLSDGGVDAYAEYYCDQALLTMPPLSPSDTPVPPECLAVWN